jgi:CRISPR-associated protein (TIGR03986 family)
MPENRNRIYKILNEQKAEKFLAKAREAKTPYTKYYYQQQASMAKWSVERGEPILPREPEEPSWNNRKHWHEVRSQARSPYVFVPLNTIIQMPELVWGVHLGPGKTTSRIYPLKTGLCADIEVEWLVETPILIGGKKDHKGVISAVHVEKDRKKKWIIPGSTLRGHIRSILQTIAYGRLWPFNHNQRFGLRDFLHPKYGGEGAAVSKAQKVRAGWLRKKENGDWEITPCKWAYVRFEGLEAVNIIEVEGFNAEEFKSWPEWLALPRIQKYKAFSMIDPDGHYNFSEATQVGFTKDSRNPERNGRPVYKLARDGSLRGHLVFSGAFPVQKNKEGNIITNNHTKRYEYVFWGADSNKTRTIDPDAMERFRYANGKVVGNSIRPEGGWADFLDTINAGKPVPVFYVGNLEHQDRDFAFGFTRMFKIVHEFSIGDMAKNSNPHHLPAADAQGGKERPDFYRPDFVENLFGYVHEPEKIGTTKAMQRKGRVSFGFGIPLNADAFEETGTVETILGGPKPSFAPFYLKGKIKDWSWAGSSLAGRKRYVPRYPQDRLSDAWSEIQQRLEDQKNAVPDASEDVITKLRFLRPKPGREDEAVFVSAIRLFNVTWAELGAILWALTFGGKKEKYRHMIGHARPFGAGQVRVRGVRLKVRPNDPLNKVWEKMLVKDGVIENCPLKPFMDAFQVHMQRMVSKWQEEQVVVCFYDACDPALWQQWQGYPDFPKGFVKLRKATQWLKGKDDALPDAPEGPLLTSCSKKKK